VLFSSSRTDLAAWHYSVAYGVYGDSNCATNVIESGTVTVTNGAVPNSSDVTFNTPGKGSYSGGANNAAAISMCTDEQLVISPLIDPALTKVDSPDPVEVGNNITWAIVVTNEGPDTATGVTISDAMAALRRAQDDADDPPDPHADREHAMRHEADRCGRRRHAR